MLRVLIADDHALVREGIKQILAEADIASVVGEARDGNEALEKGLTEHWDVILLDITMPRKSGFNVLKALLASHAELRVIMLSMHSDPIYVKSAIKTGAAGYLSKEAAPGELIAAISQVLAGQTYLSESLRNLSVTDDLPPQPDAP